MENSDKLHGVSEVNADETDDAESHAVALAIDELKGKLEHFTIVCDHESALSIINREDRRQGEKRPVLIRILQELEENPHI